MPAPPSALRPKRFPLLHWPDQRVDDPDWIGKLPPGRAVLRSLRVLRRLAFVLLTTLLAAPVQAVLLLLPGTAKARFPVLYWTCICHAIGLHVQVVGTPALPAAGRRPVVYVSNHSSWLDILVLGSTLQACFVAKQEVSRWPLISTVAKLGRSVFVGRRRASMRGERDAMRARLARGDSLILFPEGTTSDGSRVLAFRSAFFSIAESDPPPIVQPVSVVYDRLAGLPTGRANRPLFAWYGDMDIASHFWRLAQHCGLRVSVVLHAPLDPSDFADRKALAATTWNTVARGAATLRQNRPAAPIGPA